MNTILCRCCAPLLSSRARRTVAFLSFSIGAVPTAFGANGSLDLPSPHGTLTAHFEVDASGVPRYSVDRGTDLVLLPSRLGFGPLWAEGFSIASSEKTHHNDTWVPLYGERDHMPDIYNQLIIRLHRKNGHELLIEFRAYDEGIAVRYKAQEPMQDLVERTEFHFPAGSFGYEEHGTEGEYARNPIAAIATDCQTPLTVELSDGSYAAVLEAANVHFPQMTVAAEADVPDTLLATLGGPGTLPVGSYTPWRLLMFARTPGEMLEHNYLELNLNAPQAIRNVSWIRPGTAMREMTLSDEGAHRVIDFAAAHHIRYVGFDDGWYGPLDYETGDATHERSFDKENRPAPPLHIRQVVDYGRTHGVGIWLYIDHRQAEKQRDVLFPLYERWGISGVKIGFVDVGSQQRTEWITETIRKAAEHHLLVDIHDSYRTTGYTRTYPNLLTVEGIRGNEHFPTPEHDATIPFTRYLAGSADYTICYYDPRLLNTHAHQLAMSIISYSPVQWIFWYDKPSTYHNEPEIEWFDHLPTVWNETRVPLGKIGEYAVLARRSGTNWYVGAIGDSQGLKLHLPMSFLHGGVTYKATLYADDPALQTATHVAISELKVTRDSILDLPLLPRGGAAIFLTPITKSSRQ
jgi:alpha-glucosidase